MREVEGEGGREYTLHRQLGSGGEAVVWLGTSEGKKFAIKIYDIEAGYAPSRELASLEMLADVPGVVKMWDKGFYGARPFIVLDYIDGETLKDEMERDGFNWKDAVAVGSEVSDTLSLIHGKGIVHRDIKPANLLVDIERVLVTDFGCAAYSGVTDDEGVMYGTLAYMAPEYVDDTKFDARLDIYALGVTMYELLTQNVPFEGSCEVELLQHIITVPPVPPHEIDSSIPEDGSLVVVKALSKDPDERYESAEAFKHAMQHTLMPKKTVFV